MGMPKNHRRVVMMAAAIVLAVAACDEPTPTAPEGPRPNDSSPPQGTRLVRETVNGIINTDSPVCSQIFRMSVDASYFSGGTGRCVEVPRRSATAGTIVASLSWSDPRIDLDLVLNNGAGTNFRQSIAANRGGERVEFFVNAGTDYVFIAYLRGIDGQFLVNGGIFTGPPTTMYTLNIERPE
jgi:hypothetical protein